MLDTARRKKIVGYLLTAAIAAAIGFSAGNLHDFAFVTHGEWSISTFECDSLFDFRALSTIRKPVLRGSGLDGVHAYFVADPFLVKDGDSLYLFFEVFNAETKRGEIGLAVSADGNSWAYRGIVLSEPFHLSFPNVFRSGAEYYMVPECKKSFSVRLYRAEKFPEKWTPVASLLPFALADPGIVRWEGRWYLLGCTDDYSMRLFWADSLAGPWTEHPKSPIYHRDPRRSRNGGRIMMVGSHLMRFAQDCSISYGRLVRAFEITKLSSSEFVEVETKGMPIVEAQGQGWNADGMHQVDFVEVAHGKWVVCVDGCRRRLFLRSWSY